MNRDMKSNDLDGPIGYMEFTSGPVPGNQRVTTQHVSACYQTKSAIAQRNGHEFVACLWV